MAFPKITLATLLAGAFLIVGCVSVERIKTTQPEAGTPFTRALTEEYRRLAQEEEARESWQDASLFARKGLSAAEGDAVIPENPRDWELLQNDQVAALDAAHGRLLDLLSGSTRADEPVLAARAQVAFECWLNLANERSRDPRLDTCRQRFEAHEADLRAATR